MKNRKYRIVMLIFIKFFKNYYDSDLQVWKKYRIKDQEIIYEIVVLLENKKHGIFIMVVNKKIER